MGSREVRKTTPESDHSSSHSSSHRPEARTPDKIRFDEAMAKSAAERFTEKSTELDKKIQTLEDTRDKLIKNNENCISELKVAVSKVLKGESEKEELYRVEGYFNTRYNTKGATILNDEIKRLHDEIDSHIQNIKKHNNRLKEKGHIEWYNKNKAAKYSYEGRLPSPAPTNWPSAIEIANEVYGNRSGSLSLTPTNRQLAE